MDVVESKLRPPALRSCAVPRSRIVNRLCRGNTAAVRIVAPAGYGKTMLAAQWASEDPRPVAWISIDARDNDARVLVKHLEASVDRIERRDRRASGLVGALRAQTAPILVVLDDADRLHAVEARRVVAALIAHAPAGSTVVITGRNAPRIPCASLRRRGRLLDLGAKDLALSPWEARTLVQGAADLDDAVTAKVVDACEGWPAALHLAAAAAGRGPHNVIATDRDLASYLRACLSHMSAGDVAFLRWISILDDLSGPLCEAVVHDKRAVPTLARLARTGLVAPVEGRRGFFRLHPLVRDVLRKELVEVEPRHALLLHRRASDWYAKTGDVDIALQHAARAGDGDRVAELITGSAKSPHDIDGWLVHFERHHELQHYPSVAVHGSRIHAFRGRLVDAERWLAAAERGIRRRTEATPALRAKIALVRAVLCRNGPQRMLTDARVALKAVCAASVWRCAALHMQACSAALLAAADTESLLEETVHAADADLSPETQMIALAQLSLLVRARGDLRRADELAIEASCVASNAELERDPAHAIVLAASAHADLLHGRWADARASVTAADTLRASLNESLPWLAVATRVALARCYATLQDSVGLRTVLDEIDVILEARPQLGALIDDVATLREELAHLVDTQLRTDTELTSAERRLLPHLATHRTFAEIAEDLGLSRNTVKTQAISIYRKLGVSGRSQALAVIDGRRAPIAA